MGCSIKVRALRWAYPGTDRYVLGEHEPINVDIHEGEKILLMGASGSGKSSLLALLAGIYHSDAISCSSNKVGMVLQDPDTQVMYSRLGDDIAFGLENIAYPVDKIWEQVDRSKNCVGLGSLDNDYPTYSLSGGQKQRMALAGVTAMQPDLLILDEPTANIDPEGVDTVIHAVREVVEHTGATIIIVEHNTQPWFDYVDRVIILDQGHILFDGTPEDIISSHADLLAEKGLWVPEEYVENKISDLFPTRDITPGDSVLETHNLSWGWDKILGSGDSTVYQEGTSTIITGPNGRGKTTYCLSLAGLLAPLSGSISPDVHRWKSKKLASYLGYVFQDPEHQFLKNTVIDELCVGVKKDKAEELLERIGLAHRRNAHPCFLSGGEKRRLSVATSLVRQPRVLILDEPTFGLDRKNFIDIVHLLMQAQDNGSAVISISHDKNLLKIFGAEKKL